MSVPTYYVCPNLLCLSSPIMSVLTYNVCYQLLCLSLPIMSIATLGSNLDSESKLCSEEPEWDLKSLLTNPPTRLLDFFLDSESMVFCVSLSPPIMSVPTFMSVPTYYVCPPFYVCPHLFRLSQPIMSVPTYYVCPHLLCLSPPIMSVPTFYVCPHLLCLSPPIMSVPTFYVCPHPSFFCWQALLKSRVWHFQPNLFHHFIVMLSNKMSIKLFHGFTSLVTVVAIDDSVDTAPDTRLVKICCTFWLFFLPDSVGSNRICWEICWKCQQIGTQFGARISLYIG